MKIERVLAREVLDSRGTPTLEVDVVAGQHLGRAIVPSGASTGRAEALELRDANLARYDGRGVLAAVGHVRSRVGLALVGMEVTDQTAIDGRLLELDPTPQKTQLGGNTLLGVSLAAAHCGARASEVPLYHYFQRLLRSSTAGGTAELRVPLPMVNLISGGLHAGGNLDFQDVLMMPIGAAEYPQGLEWSVRVYRRLGALLAQDGYEGRLVGDEGGYGPRLPDNRSAIEYVVRAIEAAGLRPGEDVTLAIDVAASHFYSGSHYVLRSEGNQALTSGEMIDRLETLVRAFPITSLEDALAEGDWQGWKQLTRRLGGQCRLVGDDLFTTNADLLRKGIQDQVANSILIKLNQIGTVTETLNTVRLARQAQYAFVVSARSGETEDTTMADLAVGTAADQIKIGSIVRSERLAKYNRLLRIWEELQQP